MKIGMCIRRGERTFGCKFCVMRTRFFFRRFSRVLLFVCVGVDQKEAGLIYLGGGVHIVFP